jgi:hypothetical protein
MYWEGPVDMHECIIGHVSRDLTKDCLPTRDHQLIATLLEACLMQPPRVYLCERFDMTSIN